jgi:hypothetical protein
LRACALTHTAPLQREQGAFASDLRAQATVAAAARERAQAAEREAAAARAAAAAATDALQAAEWRFLRALGAAPQFLDAHAPAPSSPARDAAAYAALRQRIGLGSIGRL